MRKPSTGTWNIMKINDWNEQESQRAENAWGNLFPPYTKDMFEFAVASGDSFLDLGCGFGRFLKYLVKNLGDPDYIGYDSSKNMLGRINKNFPEYSIRNFLRDVTDPITHPQEVILCSAVFIHIVIKDQQKILNNISKLIPKPKAFIFDINCPAEAIIDRLKSKQSECLERWMKTKAGSSQFRMTWQSHYDMTKRILTQFTDYKLTTKFYSIKPNQHKVVYILERK